MVKPSGARHGTVFNVTGFTLDNSVAGFHFETTANKTNITRNIGNTPSLRIMNTNIIIDCDPKFFHTVCLYSLDGKTVATRSVYGNTTVISRRDAGVSAKNSVYLIVLYGSDRSHSTAGIW